MPRRLLLLVLTAAALLAPAAAAPAASPDIVISQVYGGGGNSGATYTNDFIELYNRGPSEVIVDGWSVQYASATSGTWQVTNIDGTIAPGGHYLVQEAAGAGGTTPLPTPDATGSIAMSGTSGKVALLTDRTPLTCSTGCVAKDLVGYGSTASTSETAPTPNLSNTTAALRNAAGADTDDNSADFTVGAPTPRNSAGPGPTVASSDPADGATGVAPGSSLHVTFSEPVTVDPDGFALACGDESQAVTVTQDGPATVTVDPQADLPQGTSCTLTIAADATDPALGAPASVDFTTTGLADLRIHQIQAATHRSPYADRWVTAVPGVVTAVSGNGFWMQDARPDRSEATSEGIFVFRGSGAGPGDAAVGDKVTVSGQVLEFRPGGSGGTTNLTTTEIGSPSVVEHGSATIRPTVIGPDGRRPPLRVIEDDARGDVELGFLFDPREDGLDFHESLEGMLVQVERPEVVGPRNSFGELPVVARDAATPRTARGGVVVRSDDFNPERMILDDVIEPTPVANVGDRLAGPVQAVVDYGFGNFKYLVTATPVRIDRRLRREVTQRPDRDQLAMASMNVENLSAVDDQAKFATLASIVVDNLRSPDILAVEEMQDDNGASTEGDSGATVTFDRFVEAIEDARGPHYEYRQIDPVDGEDGGEPGGNIRVGFLFRTDRGLDFVDRGDGDALTPTTEDTSRPGAQLTLSPGRVDPTNDVFDNSRKPLAAEFHWRGRTVFAIANHFNSKGGDQPLFGRFQPPERSSEVQRHGQAAVVRDFVRSVLRADRHAAIAVLGDLNDFEFSRTLEIVESGGLANLMETLPKSERYSYVFDGNSQVLDQILVSAGLLRTRPEYDSVHVNAEFADQASDHDPQVARVGVR